MSRNPKIHSIDRLCGDIINRYPQSLELANMFYRDRTIVTGNCPDWCALPSSFMAWHIAGSNNNQTILNIHNQETVYHLTAALIWSRSKMIYRFDDTLANTLAAQSLDGKIPTDIFDYLPYPCVYVERKMKILNKEVSGFFAWLDWGTKEDKKLLKFSYTHADGFSYLVTLPISGGTIQESILDLVNSDKKSGNHFTEGDIQDSPVAQLLIECVNLLLYLCSEKPDIPDDTQLKNRRSRDKCGNPKRTAIWEVGTRIGAALRKAREANADEKKEREESESSVQSRSVMRPHLRRAHWHSFWTGKRDGSKRKLVLRWLPPIAVKIGDTKLPAVITAVKGKKRDIHYE